MSLGFKHIPIGEDSNALAETYTRDILEYEDDKVACMEIVDGIMNRNFSLDLNDSAVFGEQIMNILEIKEVITENQVIYEFLTRAKNCKNLMDLFELVLRMQGGNRQLADSNKITSFRLASNIISKIFGPFSDEHRAIRIYIRHINSMAREMIDISSDMQLSNYASKEP